MYESGHIKNYEPIKKAPESEAPVEWPTLKEEENMPQPTPEKVSTIFSVITELRAAHENEKNANELWRRRGVTADGDKIEGQQIDVIDDTKNSQLVVTCKLVGSHYKTIIEKARALAVAGLAKETKITYETASSNLRHDLSEAIEIEHGDIKIIISSAKNDHQEIRAALGLVRIEIPDEKYSAEEALKRVQSIFGDILSVEKALEAPNADQEKEYKLARYCWQNKIERNNISLAEKERLLKALQREQVLPGYATMVEPGRTQELEKKYSQCAIYHSAAKSALPKIIQAAGLLSTHERYRR